MTQKFCRILKVKIIKCRDVVEIVKRTNSASPTVTAGLGNIPCLSKNFLIVAWDYAGHSRYKAVGHFNCASVDILLNILLLEKCLLTSLKNSFPIFVATAELKDGLNHITFLVLVRLCCLFCWLSLFLNLNLCL